MTTETITIVVNEKGARVVSRSIEDIGASAAKSSKSVDILKGALAGVGAYLGLSAIKNYTSAWTDLQARAGLAVKDMSRGAEVMDRLGKMARRTYSDLNNTAEGFLQNSTALRELGYNTEQSLDYVEALNNALVVSGAKAQRAETVMNALSRAMGQGELRGNDLNTVLASGGRVAEVLAEHLGTTTTGLRELSRQGKLTTDVIYTAMVSALDTLREEADAMPATINDAFTIMSNKLMEYIGQLNESTGAGEALAKIIIAIADNLDLLAKALGAAAIAWGAYWLAANVGAMLAVATNVIATAKAFLQLTAGLSLAAKTMAFFNVVLMANPIGLLITGFGLAVGAIVMFRSEIAEALRSVEVFGTNVLQILQTTADVIIGTFMGVFEVINSIWDKLFANILGKVKWVNDILGGKLVDKQMLDSLYEEASQSAGRTVAENFKIGFDKWADRGFLVDELTRGLEPREGVDPIEKVVKTATGDLKELEEQYKKLQSAIRDSWTEEERLLAKIKELEGLRGIAKTAEDAIALETAIERANKELEEIRIKAERNSPVAKAFESLAKQVDDGFREAFRNAFTQGDGGWRSMLDGWKASFRTFLADLAYMAFARPIILSVVAGVGAGMGVSTGARADILGAIGGTGGSSGGILSILGGVGNLSSLVTGGLSSLNAPIFGASSLIGKGINWIGAQLGLNNASFVGPMMPGMSNLASAFTPAAGIAGFGGNLLANMLFGDRGIGATIGGTLGGIGGTAIGASLAALGSFGGPIGALAGAFLGNVVGGLFGKKGPSAKYQGGYMDLATQEILWSGGQTGKKFSQANADARDAIGEAIAAYTQLLQAAGATINGTIGYGVSGKAYHGMGFGVGTQDTTKFQWFKKSEDLVEALFSTITDMAEGLRETYQTILSKVGFSDIEKLTEAFAFGEFFESVINPVDAVAEAIKAVNAQFDALIKQADDLGLTNAVFTEEMQKRRQAELDLIKAQQAGFQSLESMKTTFDKWLYDQSLSSTSSLSPIAKLTAAQANFGDLLAKAQGGDYTVTQDLLAAGQQLLQIGQSMYASSTSFAALEQMVRSSIESVARQLNIPGYASGTQSARSGWAWVGEEGPELVRFGGGETVIPASQSAAVSQQQHDAVVREVSAMRADIQNMSRNLSRVASRLIVEKREGTA